MDDFDKVRRTMIAANGKVYITPYIAAEVSNLIDLTGYVNELVMRQAAIVFEALGQINVSITDDTKGMFPNFGITDNSLIELVKEHSVLTDDRRLAAHLFGVNWNNVLLLDHL
ncbi:hypothetical protein UJ39_17095 [Salmonella enterica subsp. enterica serovar Tennessee]|nr:hypothetical protein [Salmonella enterica subsp. enterica serovar Tennessee]EEI4529355.1 hypothetical protein [Salmonella enterica]